MSDTETTWSDARAVDDRVPAPPSTTTGSGFGDAATTAGTGPRPPIHAATQLTRRGRLRKWDRPPPPHDWRWYVGNLGKVLIVMGLLMFGFVGYQLWGTGIETARAQRSLESDFESMLAAAPAVEFSAGDPFLEADAPPVGEPSTDADPATSPEPTPESPVDGDGDGQAEPDVVVPVAQQNIPFVENGDAIARLEIPRIGVNDIVVAGVDTSDLKKGPGHFPDTPLPGQLGNAAIAGHRTTYGQPFRNVDKLEVGDEIRVTTLSGVFVYRVTGQQIVAPSDYQVVATTDPATASLTLTSCHPVWSASQRIVISSVLDRTESATIGEPTLNYGRPDPVPVDQSQASEQQPTFETPDEAGDGGVSGNLVTESPDTADELGTADTNESIADAFAEGWFSDPSANPQVGLWGLALALIGIASYLISRRFRRDWVGALVGIVPFVVALYFFFQNVNRLLPPNL